MKVHFCDVIIPLKILLFGKFVIRQMYGDEVSVFQANAHANCTLIAELGVL